MYKNINFYCEGILSHLNKKASGYCFNCSEYLCKQRIRIHKHISKSEDFLRYKVSTPFLCLIKHNVSKDFARFSFFDFSIICLNSILLL